MAEKRQQYQIFIFILLWLSLPIFFQNCGDPASGGLWSLTQPSCANSLCNKDGRGDISKISLSLNLNNGTAILPLVKPGISLSPLFYTLNVSGTCSDGGFVRNKVVAHLGTLYTATSNCVEGAFSIQLNITEDLVGEQLTDGQTYPAQLEVQLLGIDNFDNEYKIANGYQKTSVIIKSAPVLSSLVQYNDESWFEYRVFEYTSQILNNNPAVVIGDVNGYCKYFGANNASNNINVSLKSIGQSDTYRIQIPNLNLKCQDINILKQNSNQKPYNTGVSFGYSGYFSSIDPIYINYNISAQNSNLRWDNSGTPGTFSSRFVNIILTQTDPNGFVVESQKRMVMKFSSIDTAQGWTLETLKQAQKQIKRAITLSWDNSTVSESDLNGVLLQGSPGSGLRNWILTQLNVTENGDGTSFTIQENGFNSFKDRVTPISLGTARCDLRLDSDMKGWAQGSSGYDVNRIALCLWYWRRHGALNHSSLDFVANWNNTPLVKALKEGINTSTCKTLISNSDIPLSECNDFKNYLPEVICLKIATSGDSTTFYRGLIQSHVNHLMKIVSYDVYPSLFGTGFFSSVISNIIEYPYSPVASQQIFPFEINQPNTPPGGYFSIYTTTGKNNLGSLGANGSTLGCQMTSNY